MMVLGLRHHCLVWQSLKLYSRRMDAQRLVTTQVSDGCWSSPSHAERCSNEERIAHNWCTQEFCCSLRGPCCHRHWSSSCHSAAIQAAGLQIFDNDLFELNEDFPSQ